MKKQNTNKSSQQSPQDSIMNHVDQTFEEMVKDVRNLINENSQKNNLQ